MQVQPAARRVAAAEKKMERQFSWLTDKQTRWLQRIRRARSQVSPDGSLYDTRPHQGAPRDDEYVNSPGQRPIGVLDLR